MKRFFEDYTATLIVMIGSWIPVLVNNIIPICQVISLLVGIAVGITYIILNLKKIFKHEK
jgi:hypothetical protein